jgi:predicted nucleotidyltransferase
VDAVAPFERVRVAVLHGSAAEEGPFRDVDLALLLGRDSLTAFERYRLEDAIAAAVEDALRIPCDVHIVDEVRPAFRYNVTRGRPVLVRDEELWANFKERTWNEYLDVQWLHDAYLRELADAHAAD